MYLHVHSSTFTNTLHESISKVLSVLRLCSCGIFPVTQSHLERRTSREIKQNTSKKQDNTREGKPGVRQQILRRKESKCTIRRQNIHNSRCILNVILLVSVSCNRFSTFLRVVSRTTALFLAYFSVFVRHTQSCSYTTSFPDFSSSDFLHVS